MKFKKNPGKILPYLEAACRKSPLFHTSRSPSQFPITNMAFCKGKSAFLCHVTTSCCDSAKIGEIAFFPDALLYKGAHKDKFSVCKSTLFYQSDTEMRCSSCTKKSSRQGPSR